MTSQDDSSQPVSWRTVRYETPVHASGGERVGRVHEVLGSDAEDIFHGLRVQLDQGGRDVMIPASDIGSMTDAGIDLTVSAEDVRGRETYDERASYHVGSVGLLNRRLGWRRDSGSDEEPGT